MFAFFRRIRRQKRRPRPNTRFIVLARTSVTLAIAGLAAACRPLETETSVADWAVVPLVRVDDGKSRSEGGIALSDGRSAASKKTVRLSGSGRFVGAGGQKTERRHDEPGAEDGVTLNFVNVPVAQAAKVVLGDILVVDYVIDPKVDGKVSIHTPRPVERSRALNLFRNALRSAGAALVDTGGVYKLVPSDQAPASGMALTTSATDGAVIGDHTNVVQLRFVSASEMKRVLEPTAPKGGVARADDARGTITLAGSPQEIATMRETIQLFDIDTMRGMSFALVAVRSSEPDAIADDLRKVFASDSEGPMNGMVKFIPNKKLKSILVISPQPRYLARAEQWIRRLDLRAAGGEKQFYTYVVQNRPAKDLAVVLNSMFSAETTGATNRQVAPRLPAATVSSQAATSAIGGQQQSASAGIFGALSAPGGTAGQMKPTLAEATSHGADMSTTASATQGGAALGDDSRMRISADDANNALIILASPQDYNRLLRMIQNLDVMPNQVLLEATIAEVSLNNELQFGVRWYLAKKASSATFSDAVSGAVSSVFPGFSYALKLANAQVTLNALQQVTDVNVVSSPSLTVMDNKTATLQVGDQVPITTQSATSVLGAGAPIVNSVTYKDTGVILSITPRVNDSGRVMLDIEQEVSSVVPTTSSGIDSPTIQQRRVKTSVVVNDHEAITLGGLVQDKQNIGRSQLPVLGDLPLVGNAFKSKNDHSGKTELIIIITPKVMRNLAEAQQVTDEFRRRLNFAYPRTRTTPRSIARTVQRVLD